MPAIDECTLSKMLEEGVELKSVEPHVYSAFQDVHGISSYDKSFGSLYDKVACNVLYNRIMWGYSTSSYASKTMDVLESSQKGWILDAGCGSLAFTARTYAKYHKRPIVFLDQSLKLIRMAKSRLIKINGVMPSNMIFIYGSALGLPFKEGTFETIISLNLIHVVYDMMALLSGLRNALVEEGGKIFLTTLVKRNNIRDRYLELWEKKGELISRDMTEVAAMFDDLGMPVKYDVKGNMAFIYYGRDYE